MRRKTAVPRIRPRRRLLAFAGRRDSKTFQPNLGRRHPRLGWPVRVALIVVAALVGFVLWPRTVPECDSSFRPGVLEAADTRGVVAVVERQVIAASPFPWGTSAAVVTRVWGDRQATRWQVSQRRSAACAKHPPGRVGSFAYDFPSQGGETYDYLTAIPSPTAVPEDVSNAWETVYHSERDFDIGAPDRFFAWLRVFPELFVLVPIAGLLVWNLVRSRRRRRGDRYLF